MKTVKVKLSELKPFPDNPRRHSDVQIDELAKSIGMFGQYRPVVVDEGNVILAGHGIVLAMQKAGRQEADCLRMEGMSENAKRKLVLADNKLADLGGQDYDAMLALLNQLEGDLEIPGFDSESLEKLLTNVDGALAEIGTETNVEDAPEQDVRGEVHHKIKCPYCKRTFIPKGAK